MSLLFRVRVELPRAARPRASAKRRVGLPCRGVSIREAVGRLVQVHNVVAGGKKERIALSGHRGSGWTTAPCCRCAPHRNLGAQKSLNRRSGVDGRPPGKPIVGDGYIKGPYSIGKNHEGSGATRES